MKCLDFDWQINEFMVYCRSTQLREKSMVSYEQTLRLFERWCADELRIFTTDKVTEGRYWDPVYILDQNALSSNPSNKYSVKTADPLFKRVCRFY